MIKPRPKNSPFPWKVSPTDETLVLDRDGRDVANILGDSERELDRMADDAALISACGELLEAARAYARECRQCGGLDPTCQRCESARLAIRKAEGIR